MRAAPLQAVRDHQGPLLDHHPCGLDPRRGGGCSLRRRPRARAHRVGFSVATLDPKRDRSRSDRPRHRRHRPAGGRPSGPARRLAARTRRTHPRPTRARECHPRSCAYRRNRVPADDRTGPRPLRDRLRQRPAHFDQRHHRPHAARRLHPSEQRREQGPRAPATGCRQSPRSPKRQASELTSAQARPAAAAWSPPRGLTQYVGRGLIGSIGYRGRSPPSGLLSPVTSWLSRTLPAWRTRRLANGSP